MEELRLDTRGIDKHNPRRHCNIYIYIYIYVY